jgi:glycosyltransferase involved in cell wall biosynthesis
MYDPTLPIIVIPAYKPDGRLPELVDALRQSWDYPVVIVDDGSGPEYNRIFKALRRTGCTVLTHRVNQGKGAALKTGVRHAVSHYPISVGYVTADADGQHLPEDIAAVAEALMTTSNTLIMGTRDFSGEQVPFKSRWGNRISSFAFGLVTGRKCPDTQTGLRGIPAICTDLFFSTRGNRFEFEMNFLMAVARADFPIQPLPIATVYEAGKHATHFHTLRDSFLVFEEILKFACSSLACAAIDISIFAALSYKILGTTASGFFLATILARLCSGGVNFVLNQRWVFDSSQKKSELVKYLILFFCQMGASGLLTGQAATLIGSGIAAKIIVDGTLFIISYLIQKHLIFNSPVSGKTRASNDSII